VKIKNQHLFAHFAEEIYSYMTYYIRDEQSKIPIAMVLLVRCGGKYVRVMSICSSMEKSFDAHVAFETCIRRFLHYSKRGEKVEEHFTSLDSNVSMVKHLGEKWNVPIFKWHDGVNPNKYEERLIAQKGMCVPKGYVDEKQYIDQRALESAIA
jgi:hypothetical protein